MDFHYDSYEISRTLRAARKDVVKAAKESNIFLLIDPKTLLILAIKANNKDDVEDLVSGIQHSIEAVESLIEGLPSRNIEKDKHLALYELLTYYHKELSLYVSGKKYRLN